MLFCNWGEFNMAGPITHNIFFEQCLRENFGAQFLFYENCNVYAQGHDLLMYSQFWDFKKNQMLSLELSHIKFREFVYRYLNICIKNCSIYRDVQVKLFIYGYISHHILDSYFHPFIMRYCNEYLPHRGTYWLHGVLETTLDEMCIEKHKKMRPISYKIHNDFIFKKVKSTQFIKNIELAVQQTYHIKGVGKKFYKSFCSLRYFMYLYRYDPYKVKRTIGNLFDQYIVIGIRDYFLNNHSSQWNNLFESSEFKKIYKTALHVTGKILFEIEKLVQDHQLTPELIEHIIPNRSAITGKDPRPHNLFCN